MSDTTDLEPIHFADERGQINAEQYAVLMSPLRDSRVAKRSQGGKTLSYLESWDVRAHLIRLFGFGNFDVETLDQHLVGTREYQTTGDNPKQMVECIWFAKVQLTLRDSEGRWIARYSESAVGSTSGPASMIGEHHDNAIKTAASDALKRCAINLGTQFGLSLYQDGSTRDVVKRTVVTPDGVEEKKPDTKQAEALAHSVGSENGQSTKEEAAGMPSQQEVGS